MSPRAIRRARATAGAAGLAAAALNILGLPFYAGGSLGTAGRWRLEHGRLTVRRDEAVPSTETFYVAPNSEGLRWRPEARFDGGGAWSVTVPLWAVWGPSLVFALIPPPRRAARGGAFA